MVSKLRSVFSSLLGPDRPNVTTSRRKRSLDEDARDDEDDDHMTPNLKRPKLHSSQTNTPSMNNDIENGVEQSPFVRVTEWMKQKALTFSENYFYKKPGQSGSIDRRQRSNKRKCDFDSMYIYKPKVNGKKRHQEPAKLFPALGHSNDEGNSESEESLPEQSCNKQEVINRLSGGGGDAGRHRCTTYHGVQPQSDLADLPTASESSHHQFEVPKSKQVFTKPTTKEIQPSSVLANKHSLNIRSRPKLSRQSVAPPSPRSTTTSYSKVFPRSSPSQNQQLKHKTSYTVKQSMWLQQKEEYQQLLQQFTTTDVNQLKPLPTTDDNHQQKVAFTDAQECHQQRIPPTTVLGSTILIPETTVRKEIAGGRVLPHHYTSQHELREAARKRLHAPSSDLSVCVTPSNEKSSIGTPSQPDFNGSDSPIITDVHAPRLHRSSSFTPEVSLFKQNLSKSVVAKEDWIKDLKQKFESSTRERIRRAEEEKIKTKIYEEKRIKEMGQLEQTIRERMLIAEKEPPVIPEPEIADDDGVQQLPLLTQEMEQIVENAWIPHPAAEILVEGFKCSLTRTHIQTLNALNWLNDEVINFYMSMLVERSEKDNYPKVHNFNTFFYPKLLQGGHKPIRRWTKKVDIFSKHLVLVPVHLGMHWCLAVIDMRKKTISYYDSMGNENIKCLNALKQYLFDEHKDKKQSELDMSEWKLVTCSEVPQQMNGSDCGMFACKYAEYLCRDASITFTQEDMPYFRRRMVWEIINKQLL